MDPRALPPSAIKAESEGEDEEEYDDFSSEFSTDFPSEGDAPISPPATMLNAPSSPGPPAASLEADASREPQEDAKDLETIQASTKSTGREPAGRKPARRKSSVEDEKAAELALDFSRALYALQSLDRFPDDEEEEEEIVAAEAGAVPGLRGRGGSSGGSVAAGGGDGHDGSGSDVAGNRKLRRFIQRRKTKAGRKGTGAGAGGFGGGGFGSDGGGGGVVEGRGDGVAARGHHEEDTEPSSRAQREVEAEEARLASCVRTLPFGDAAVEAIERTLDQEESMEGGGKVWMQGRRAGDRESPDEIVEAAARRTALWSVALGERVALQDSERVSRVV